MRATPERVWAAIHETDLASSWIVRLLMAIRTAGPRRFGLGTLERSTREAFTVVAEDPPREILIGIEGPFWRLSCRPQKVSWESYRRGPLPGSALAAWNFTIGDGILETETRIACGDPASRRRFGLYWLVIRPGSGIIRRSMLRSIRRAAERQ